MTALVAARLRAAGARPTASTRTRQPADAHACGAEPGGDKR